MDIGPSFAKFIIENRDSYGVTEIEAAFLAGAFFIAGSTTVSIGVFLKTMAEIRYQTSVAICTVLMAAVCFPEEQAKVQAELDAVVGRHRGI